MRMNPRLLELAKDERVAILLTVGLGLAGGALTVVQAALLTRVIASVFLQGQDLAAVSRLLAGLLLVMALRAGTAWGAEISGNASAVRIKASLRSRLFAHLLALGPAWVQNNQDEADQPSENHRTGELISVAVEGIEALDAYFSQYLPQIALAALVPLTFLLFVFPIDFLSGLILLLTAPLIPVFMILIGNLAQALTRRQWQTLNRMSAYFLDVLQGLTTLKMLGRSRAQARVLAEVSERFREKTMSVLRVTFLSALVLELVSTLSTAVVAVTVGLRLLYGYIPFEEAFFVLLLAPEFYLPLRMLGTRFHAGMAGVEAARKIFAVLSLAPQAEPAEARPASELREFQRLSFDRVSFAYPDGREALREVSFELRRGERVALVGPSGAGKSTIASLLLRFLEPTAGAILVNGRPLNEIPASEWRSLVAWVPQKPYLFTGTVAENIGLGRPGASQAEIERAARLANAHQFIQSLPDGYQTRLGERAARLSGGQAQRIALARAFLKDAPVLLLDEASANLDPANEAAVQESLARLMQGRTVLAIAHRLGTAAASDRILVLEQGRIVQAGRHDELQRAGLYGRLLAAYQEIDGGRSDVKTAAATAETGSASRQLLRSSASLPKEAGGGPGAERTRGKKAASGGSTLLRLLSLLRHDKSWVALSALLGFATIASSIGLLTTSAYIISAAALRPSIAVLNVPIVGVRFFGIARGLSRYLERYVTHQTTFRLLARLRVWFYEALEPLAPARLMEHHSGDLLARILGDVETLENFFVRVVAPPLSAILTAAAAGVFLGLYDASLAAALLALLAAAGLGVPFLARRLSLQPGQALVRQRAALSASLVDGIQGMPELLAYNLGPQQLDRVEAAGRSLAAAQRRMAGVSGLQSGLMSLLTGLGAWVVLRLAIPLVNGGQIQGVHLAVVTLAAMTAFEAVSPLPLAAQVLESSLEAARRLFDVVDAEPAVLEAEHALPLPERFDLRIENCTFSYPGNGGQPAVKDLSLWLPQGKRLAVVGPSGAGKSTLVNLLLRFWEAPQGSIFLQGRDLSEYNSDELRQRVGVITQNTYLFNAPVSDNLLLARPGARQEELEEAARQAEIHDFICSLPQGYATWIGEQGLRLSGGERQRVAIARALLKDAPLLILDEATANLDAITEQRVLRTVLVSSAGRSLLLITHRLVGLEAMDEILVMDDGCVVERGTHARLLAAGGLYRRLWDLQRESLDDRE